MDKSARAKALRPIHVRAKDRSYITSNLSMLLKAGVSVGEALEALRQTSKSKALRQTLAAMEQNIDDGMQLGKALELSGIASEQTLALVQLGEQSGNLAENLRVAAAQEEKQRIFKSKVRSALLYPMFVLGVTAIVAIGVAWFLLPRLADTFTSLNVELPLITQIFISFGVFLQQNGLWVVPSATVIILCIGYIIFAAPKTKRIGQSLLLHTPGISKLLHEVEIARFGYLLGTLLEAGLSVVEALQLLQRATSSPAHKKLYQHLQNSFEDGYSFAASFPMHAHSHTLLPAAVQQMVIAGERSGALPDTLKNIGTIYEDKADISTQNLEAVIEPILLIIVWLGVMGVAVAVILPIYSLVGGLGG